MEFVWALPEDIPEREQWLYLNPSALESVLKGIEQAENNEGIFLGSFSKFDDDELEFKEWSSLSAKSLESFEKDLEDASS